MELDAWEIIAIIFMFMFLNLLFLALKIWVIGKIIKSMIGGVADAITGKVSGLVGGGKKVQDEADRDAQEFDRADVRNYV